MISVVRTSPYSFCFTDFPNEKAYYDAIVPSRDQMIVRFKCGVLHKIIRFVVLQAFEGTTILQSQTN